VARTETSARASRRDLLALATWPLLLAACRRAAPSARPVPPGATVLALGDSLTHGTGAPPEASYPAVLAQLTGWRVVNAGVSGDTSAQGLARLGGLLAEHSPALVLIGLGGNDLLRRLPEDGLRANLKSIIQTTRASGAQAMLLAVPRPTLAAAFTGSLADHPLYGQVAEESAAPLQRQGWSEVLSDAQLRSDSIHASALGYAQFARSLRSTAIAAGLLAR